MQQARLDGRPGIDNLWVYNFAQLYVYKDWSRHSHLAFPTAIALQRAVGPKILSNTTPTSKNRVRVMRKGAQRNGDKQWLFQAFQPVCFICDFLKEVTQMDAQR